MAAHIGGWRWWGVRNKAVWYLWGSKDVFHHKEADSPEFKTFVTVRQ